MKIMSFLRSSSRLPFFALCLGFVKNKPCHAFVGMGGIRLGNAIATTSLEISTSWISSKHSRKFSSNNSEGGIPEPGPCPECQDENTYWDGVTLFVCTSCAHEWPITAADGDDNGEDNDAATTRDVNGNILETNDSCVLIKDLAKGKLKKGLKVKIRLGDYGDGHDCEATIPGVGTYALKSEFLKRV